jgi:hypothetical protein
MLPKTTKSNHSVDRLRGPSALPTQPFRHGHCPHGHRIGPGVRPIKREMRESPMSPQSGLGKAFRSRGRSLGRGFASFGFFGDAIPFLRLSWAIITDYSENCTNYGNLCLFAVSVLLLMPFWMTPRCCPCARARAA